MRNVKVSGISFDPGVWERLEEEASQMERPNRSLVVERALKQFFDIQDGKAVVVVLTQGAA